MQTCLQISYDALHKCEDENECFKKFKNCSTPFSDSEVFEGEIYSSKLLINERERKVFELKISRKNIGYPFENGATIGVLPENDGTLVDELLLRLGLETVANKIFNLCITPTNTKKNATIPKHIPNCSTLREVFLKHVDLQGIPKKLFLKKLVKYVNDIEERNELEELCSPNGSLKYNEMILSHSARSLIGLLNRFPSCQPPIEILLENLPPLFPRPYSISSSPLISDYFSITFNVDTFLNNEKGLCSKWLEKKIETFEHNETVKIPFYFRKQNSFKLTDDNSIPIILVATGTGIAPFRGFLEHRHLLIVSQNIEFGKCWLFYGCRNNSNYLYKDDLSEYSRSGALTNISESFSRNGEFKTHVQDNIEKNGDELSSLIFKEGALIYICGDFKKVIPSVRKAFINVFMKSRLLSENEAESYLHKLEKEKRYLVDSWC